jgi:hypothetical protein
VKTKSLVQGKKQANSLYFRKDEHSEKRWTNGRASTIQKYGALNRYNTRRDEGIKDERRGGACSSTYRLLMNQLLLLEPLHSVRLCMNAIGLSGDSLGQLPLAQAWTAKNYNDRAR